MRTYRFYNGQRARVMFLQFSDNPCRRIISTGLDTRVSSIAGEEEGRWGARGKARGRGRPRVIRATFVKSAIGTLRSRIARPCIAASILREFSDSVLPVSPLHWSLASSLVHPFSLSAHPSPNPLSCSFISFSLLLTVVFLHFHPSSSFLLPPARDAHTPGMTSRGQHVGELKHLPSSSFLDSLRPLSKSGLGGQKNVAISKAQNYFLF